MINFIHPSPAIKASTQLKQANDSGSVPTQMNYSVQEIDRQTTLYKNVTLYRKKCISISEESNINTKLPSLLFNIKKKLEGNILKLTNY